MEKKIQKEVFQLSKDWIFYFIAMQILRVARKRIVRTVENMGVSEIRVSDLADHSTINYQWWATN